MTFDSLDNLSPSFFTPFVTRSKPFVCQIIQLNLKGLDLCRRSLSHGLLCLKNSIWHLSLFIPKLFLFHFSLHIQMLRFFIVLACHLSLITYLKLTTTTLYGSFLFLSIWFLSNANYLLAHVVQYKNTLPHNFLVLIVCSINCSTEISNR